MAENEKVKKWFETELSMRIEESLDAIECEDMMNICVQALEEIQQYRAIGTVEEIQQKLKNMSLVIDTDRDLINRYIAIGTIEEFKALKEKNTPMELDEHNFQDEVHHYLCPSCRSIVSCTQNYCEECGQALEV